MRVHAKGGKCVHDTMDLSPETLWLVLRDVAFYIVLLAVGALTGRFLRGTRRGGSQASAKPDHVVPGFPLLGSALALGRHGAAFLACCRAKFGDVFMIALPAGQQMLWLHDRALLPLFFNGKEEQVTFRPAVEQFTMRVFGLPSKLFFPKHAQCLQDLRELLVPTTLQAHAASLAAAVLWRMDAHLPAASPSDTTAQVDLFLAIRRLVFGAGVECLFGPDAALAGSSSSSSRSEQQEATGGEEGRRARRRRRQVEREVELEEVFHRFEAAFELAASPLPHALQPDFLQSRAALLEWLGHVHQSGALAGGAAGTLLEKADLPAELAPNFLLAVLWASQANSVAACFWTVAMLLLPSNQKWAQEVLAELQAAGAPPPGSAVPSLEARAAVRALDRKSCASRCAAEATRLRVQTIDVRMAASTFTLTTSSGAQVEVPKGCILAINPYASHHDPQLYPDPCTFNPNRNPPDLGPAGPASTITPAVAGLAFGAGVYRCPGRFFAEMEVALVAQLVLASRRLTLPAAGAPDQASVGGQGGGGEATGWAAAFALADKVVTAVAGKEAATWGVGAGLPWPTAPGGHPQVVGAGVEGEGEAGAWLEHSGDPGRQLPAPDLRRLVGVKVPAAPMWVCVAAV